MCVYYSKSILFFIFWSLIHLDFIFFNAEFKTGVQGWGWSSVVEYLPSMCKALGWNPNNSKERKEGRKAER
jgi:hypothetical protein